MQDRRRNWTDFVDKIQFRKTGPLSLLLKNMGLKIGLK